MTNIAKRKLCQMGCGDFAIVHDVVNDQDLCWLHLIFTHPYVIDCDKSTGDWKTVYYLLS